MPCCGSSSAPAGSISRRCARQLEGSLKRGIKAANAIGGNDLVITADGLTYIVKNNVVVTILTDAMPVTGGARR